MNKYFIYYDFYLKDGRKGTGNVESQINSIITCIDDIRAMEKSILNDNKEFEKVIISNYIEFPDLRRY